MTKHEMTMKQIGTGELILGLSIGDTIKIIDEQKVIDLSKVVGTSIPMLAAPLGALVYMTAEDVPVSSHAETGLRFDTSENNWVSWGSHVPWYTGKCPLPDGVEYKVATRVGCYHSGGTYWKATWNSSDITAFRVTGLEDGYIYPWQQEKNND